MSLDELVAALTAAPDAQVRRELLSSQPDLINLALVQKLKERASQAERDDAHDALAMGRIAEEVADHLNDDAARAIAIWSQANAYGHIDYEMAVQKYEVAAGLFRAANQPLEAARTGIGRISGLTYLGRYDEAITLAETTRAVFVSEGDALSQAKLDMNLGNLYDQSGKLPQALISFQNAITTFESLGESLYVAMSQVNAGNILLQLDNFIEAEALYAKAQPVFESAGLRTAVAVLYLDIALLQYGRGHYAKAFRTFERARTASTAVGMDTLIAQGDLYESDLYLDLNLPTDALRLAGEAERTFVQKGASFELARARANRAIALARLKPNREAIQLLGQARELFKSAGNEMWATHAELQRAEVLSRVGETELANTALVEVADQYQRLGLKTKRAYASIVVVDLLINNQQWDDALAALDAAYEALGTLSVPWLTQRLETQYGRAHEGKGGLAQAIDHYQAAVEQIESIATAISAEEHRTAFVADKMAPYEALVTLLAAQDAGQALAWAERAKSRALVDLLAGNVQPQLRLTDAVDQRRAETLRNLREELNWLYTRLTRVAGPDESGPPVAGPEILPRIHEKEQQVMALWRDLQAKHAETISLQQVSSSNLSEVQRNLPDGTLVVEYSIARGQLFGFVVGREQVTVHPALVSLDILLPLLEELAFQFSKFQYGPLYYQRHQSTLYEAVVDVLNQLFQHLLEPLWPQLAQADLLIIIPHGPLHALPFHALYRDGRPLIETHTISYAPSMAVLQFCWQKNISTLDTSLLLGLSDDSIPQVIPEVQALARQLPKATLLTQDDATYTRLHELAPSCSILHLATHGIFRPEAPMLSGVRLADRWLTTTDVYDLNLAQTSLVTLSACESGLGQVAGGDDVVGLVRGFLYAGAASLVVSLWKVGDESMITLMDAFYKALLAGETKARALRQAQRTLMKTHPHPYFWGPLVLVGNEK